MPGSRAWDERRDDATVWAIACLFVRAGYRRRGVSRELARAAVGFSHEHGARAALAEELHVGTERTFAAAGLATVSRPTARRVVMRRDFQGRRPPRSERG